MGQQGTYPIGSRVINVNTDTATGLVTGTTCDIPLNAMALAIQVYLNLQTPVAIASGGTGATTVAGALANLGIGTMGLQNSNNVSITGGTISGVTVTSANVTITGGTINGTSIGQITPAAGAFTTLTATTPVGVASGGTGVATLTAHGVLIGEGTAAINQTTAGTAGQPLLSGGASADPAFGTLGVNFGGTGATTLTVHGVLLGEGTATIAATAVGTTGQVLVGATGADPAFGTTVGGLTFTGAITPQSTGGIVGTTTNDNANAGSVGEYVTATVTNVTLTNASYIDIATISLSAGDWDVTGVIAFNPAGSTVIQAMLAGINTVANTAPSFPNQTQLNGLNLTAGSANFITAPLVRESLASTTTLRLGAQCNFTTSTCTASGMIRARRIR